MLVKSESPRAWMRFMGLSLMACSRCSRHSWRAADHAGEQRETVEGVVGRVVFEQDFLEVLAGIVVLAVVQQRDGVVVALLVGAELRGALVNLRDAGGDVHPDAIGKIVGRALQQRVEGRVRLGVLARCPSG